MNLTNIHLIKIHHKIWRKTQNLHMKSVAENKQTTLRDSEESYSQITKSFWDTVKAKHLNYFCKLKYKVTHKYLGMPELDQKVSTQPGKQTGTVLVLS